MIKFIRKGISHTFLSFINLSNLRVQIERPQSSVCTQGGEYGKLFCIKLA
nr:MAG TPA: hypothetical protein [Bacteriophage sp.]